MGRLVYLTNKVDSISRARAKELDIALVENVEKVRFNPGVRAPLDNRTCGAAYIEGDTVQAYYPSTYLTTPEDIREWGRSIGTP